MIEEFPRRPRRATFVGRRKMLTDIAFTDTASNGIGDGMQADIGIARPSSPWLWAILRPQSQIWSPSLNL